MQKKSEDIISSKVLVNKNGHKIDGHYSVKVIRSIEEFKNLKDMWDDLAGQNDSYFPWLCHEWFSLFIKFFSDNAELFIVILFKGNEAVALAPFFLREDTYKGIAKVKKIELIGNVHSPIRNFFLGHLSDQKRKVNVLKILRYFIDIYKDWDILELERVPTENKRLLIVKDAITESGLKYNEYFCEVNWFLNGINHPTCFVEHLPKGLQKDIQYCKRRLERMGKMRFQMEFNPHTLDYHLDLYDDLRKKSWKAPEKDKPFIREFMKVAAEQGWLRFPFLFFNDMPIASQKWLVVNNVAYILSTVYDEDYKKFSPGSVLSAEIFQYVIEHDRVTEIDYLTGDEAYKKLWTPNRRERKGIVVFNNNIKGNLLAFLMLSILPVFEKSRVLRSVKNRISSLLKKSSCSK